MQLNGALFFITVNMFMGNMFNALLVFQGERPVFLREQSNRMYNVGPYYLAKTLADAPILCLTPFIAILVTYFAIGLEFSLAQFLMAYLVQASTAWTASSVGYFLSSLFENETTATGLSPVVIMPMMLFGGLLANNVAMPAWLSWFQYVSPIKYGAEALLYNEFRNDEVNRDALTKFLGYELGYWKSVGISIALILLFRLFAFIGFKSLVRKF